MSVSLRKPMSVEELVLGTGPARNRLPEIRKILTYSSDEVLGKAFNCVELRGAAFRAGHRTFVRRTPATGPLVTVGLVRR